MLKVTGKENNEFIVKDSESGHVLKIVDTFAEMLPKVEISPEGRLIISRLFL